MPVKLSYKDFLKFIYILLSEERCAAHGIEFVNYGEAMLTEVEGLGKFSVSRQLADDGHILLEISHRNNVRYLSEEIFKGIPKTTEKTTEKLNMVNA